MLAVRDHSNDNSFSRRDMGRVVVVRTRSISQILPFLCVKVNYVLTRIVQHGSYFSHLEIFIFHVGLFSWIVYRFREPMNSFWYYNNDIYSRSVFFVFVFVFLLLLWYKILDCLDVLLGWDLTNENLNHASPLPFQFKGKGCIRAKWPIRPELIPISVAWSD